MPISANETLDLRVTRPESAQASTTMAAPALENVPTRRLPAERFAMASTSSSATASCSKAAAGPPCEGSARLGQPQRARAAVDERRADLALEAGHDFETAGCV